MIFNRNPIVAITGFIMFFIAFFFFTIAYIITNDSNYGYIALFCLIILLLAYYNTRKTTCK